MENREINLPSIRLNLILLLFFIMSLSGLRAQYLLSEIVFKNQGHSFQYTGDIDGDGNDDIVTNGLVWYRNLGDGYFDKAKSIIPITIDLGYSISSMELIDFDGDGDLDIFAGSFESKVSYFENLGSGEFGPEQVIATYTEGTFVETIRIIDLDGDGDFDLLNLNDNLVALTWSRNLGAGLFDDPINLSAGFSGGSDAHAEDIDLDGDLDIIAVSQSPYRITLFENLGEGIFGTAVVIDEPFFEPVKMNCVDLNEDSYIDLVVSMNYADIIYSYQNLGDGTFDTPDTVYRNVDDPFYSDRHNIMSFDMDNDGDLDLFSAASGYELCSYENNGDGTYGTRTNISTGAAGGGGYRIPLTSGDYDSDGDYDLVTGRVGDKVILHYENLGEGVFDSDSVLIPWMDGLKLYRHGDLNEDGQTDIVIASWLDKNIWYFKNLEEGTYGLPEKIISMDYECEVFELIDMDLDDDLDLVYGDDEGSVLWIENFGDDEFGEEPRLIGTVPEAITSISSANTNDDFDSDVFVSSSTGNISWFETFSLLSDVYVEHEISTDFDEHSSCGHTVDVDSDGDLDFVYLSESFLGNTLKIRYNEDEDFSSLSVTAYGADKFCRIEDLNGDGLVDICFAFEDDHGIGWVENLGDGEFSDEKEVRYVPGTNVIALRLEDINEDGLTDIVSYYYDGIVPGGNLYWFRNLGGGIFASAEPLFPDGHLASSKNIDFADLDGDDKKELLAGSDIFYKAHLFWFNGFYEKVNEINGYLFADLNENGIFDSLDVGINDKKVYMLPSESISFTSEAGDYNFLFGDTTQTYTILPDTIKHWSLSTDSLFYTVHVDSNFYYVDSLNFGFTPDSIIEDIRINLQSTYFNCFDTARFCITLENIGTTIPSGVINVNLDESLTFISSDVMVDSISGTNIYWHFDSLNFFATEKIRFLALYPSDEFEDSILTSVLEVITDSSIIFLDSLTEKLSCDLIGNRKTVEPIGFDERGFIPITTEELTYTIYFQNTTGDTVNKIVIVDPIDSGLISSSIDVISSSHPVISSVDDDIIKFEMNDIAIPDSSQSYFGSLGFIQYSIGIDSAVSVNDDILNAAVISFDSSAFAVTDTTNNRLFDCESFFDELKIPEEICQFDSLVSDAFVPNFGTAYWMITGIDEVSHESFVVEWYPDTFGIAVLDYEVDFGFCSLDTTISINVSPVTINILDTYEICQNDSINIMGEWRKESGFIFDTIPSFMGCDTYEGYELIVHPTYLDTIEIVEICEGDSALIFGEYVSESGVYEEPLLSINGCDSISAIQLNLKPSYFNIIYPTLHICSGDSIEIFGEYRFEPGYYYDSLVAVNGCDSVYRRTLNVTDLDAVEIVGWKHDTICSDHGMIELTGFPYGGDFSGPGVTESTFDPSAAGVGTHSILYFYEDEHDCSTTAEGLITVVDCLGLNEQNNQSIIMLYPNPAHSFIVIESAYLLKTELEVKIFDISGRRIYESSMENVGNLEISVENWSKGLYIVEVYLSSGNEVFSQKVIVE